jgi:SAM-dependent methyltransferase
MNWRWKARLVKVIAALPMSDAIYYRVQRCVGSLQPKRYDPSERLRAAAKMVHWAEELGYRIEGRSFLEVGTGRTLDIPLALWLCGAARVLTVDLNTYLAEQLTLESVAFLCSRRAETAAIFGELADRPLFNERLDQLRRFDGLLADLMRMTHIEYLAPTDAAHLSVPDRSIDFHISFTVLEHIPADIIASILKEAGRVLTPGGLLLHIIDPSDHFSHDDGSITAVNFLQFSDREWTRLAGNKFMYHNRLRAYEYVELFKRAGVRLIGQREAIDEQSLAVLRNGFGLDQRFCHIDHEHLAVRSIILMGEAESPAGKKSPVPQSSRQSSALTQ